MESLAGISGSFLDLIDVLQRDKFLARRSFETSKQEQEQEYKEVSKRQRDET